MLLEYLGGVSREEAAYIGHGSVALEVSRLTDILPLAGGLSSSYESREGVVSGGRGGEEDGAEELHGGLEEEPFGKLESLAAHSLQAEGSTLYGFRDIPGYAPCLRPRAQRCCHAYTGHMQSTCTPDGCRCGSFLHVGCERSAGG